MHFFKKHEDKYNGWLYIGYPIVRTDTETYPVDALWVSKEKGVIIFDLIEGQNKDIDNYQETQDDHFVKIQSKLFGYKRLVKGRKLRVSINVVTFYPALPDRDTRNEEGAPLCNEHNLESVLDRFSWPEGEELYSVLLSNLQAVSTIRTAQKRNTKKENSRGQKLQNIEDQIATLDLHQNRAVIETVDGIQRIRGLAGSGKTIVLALKAAYLHAQNPDWNIAVSFNTRSLKELYKHLITNFYIQQRGEEPNWNKLHIIHAWGAPGGGFRDGLYYTFCRKNNIRYYDYNSAVRAFGRTNTFGSACDKALQEAPADVNGYYDAILIDEAQDFSPFFLRLCYCLLKNPKRLVYAYDELQNLGQEALPSPDEIFGKMQEGVHVQDDCEIDGSSRQDIILEKCYRNSREALVTAHALGFGIYRTPSNAQESTGIIQMFENSALWGDIGYKVQDGKLEDGVKVRLGRTPESSPLFLEQHSPEEDLVYFKCFNTKQE